jgi:hypothetical protein
MRRPEKAIFSGKSPANVQVICKRLSQMDAGRFHVREPIWTMAP